VSSCEAGLEIIQSTYQKRGDGVEVLPLTTFCSWFSFWQEKGCFVSLIRWEEVGLDFGDASYQQAARIRDELDVPVSILEHRERGSEKEKSVHANRGFLRACFTFGLANPPETFLSVFTRWRTRVAGVTED